MASVYVILLKSAFITASSLLIIPFSMKLSKNFISNGAFSNAALMMCFIISSAKSISSLRSANAISGSIIQNSDACLGVFEFSALNVGPKVYTFLNASAIASASSCPLTVRPVFSAKKSLLKSSSFDSKVVTLKSSPAPSQSFAVIIGVCE